MVRSSTPAPMKPNSISKRLAGLRNFQSHDFWAMVFARPMTILLLLPVADIRWVTPNVITAASVVVKLAGIAGLLLWPSYWGGVAAVLLVNLGLVLDNADGTLARYRGTSSYVGYYLDKSVDIVGHALMFAAVAFRVYWVTGEIFDMALPFAAFAGASVASYCKWIAQRVETDMELLVRLKNGTLDEFARRRAAQNPSEEPPARSFKEWLLWAGEALKSILYFNEVDIPFFLLLALVLDEPWVFTRLMCSLYTLGLFIGPAMFYFKLRKKARQHGFS